MSSPSPLLPARQRARDLASSGDLRQARAVLEHAVGLGRTNLGEDDPGVLAAAHDLAGLHLRADDPSAARRVLEEAYAAGQWRLGDSDPLMLEISYEIGVVAEELGNRHEARKAFARVAQFGPGVLGEQHRVVVRSREYLNGEMPRPPVPGGVAHVVDEPTMIAPIIAPITRQPGAPPPGQQSAPPYPQQQSAPPYPGQQSAPPYSQQSSAPPYPSQHSAPPYPQQYSAAPDQQQQSSAPPYRSQHSASPYPDQQSAPPYPQQYSAPPYPDQHSAPPAHDWQTSSPYPRQPVGPVPPRSRVPQRRGLVLFATIAAVLAAAIAVVALVVVLARGDGDGGEGDAPSLGGGPAPSDVRLVDSGSSVRVSWRDPADGRTTFVISGGRAGLVLEPMGKVGPGETQFELNGLNPQLDYCFAVVAMYSATEFASSPQACTSRVKTK